MDFSAFNTKLGAEEGRFLHLRHIKTRELLYEDVDKKREKVGIYLRGLESKTVLDAVKTNKSKTMTGESDDAETATAQALVISFQNISRKGNPLTTSVDDLNWFFGLSNVFVQDVISFASNSGNFLPVD